MTIQRPEGSFVALITPMNADGSIDFEGFRTLFQFHEENGTSALLIMGSTGEVSMLTQKERHTIVHPSGGQTEKVAHMLRSEVRKKLKGNRPYRRFQHRTVGGQLCDCFGRERRRYRWRPVAN